MNTQNASTAVIAILVVAWIFYRQLSERPVKDNPLKLPIILGIIGVVQAANYLDTVHSVPVDEVVAVIAGFCFAALIAIPRAHSMRIYRNTAGVLVRKGNVLTLLLWVVAIAAHIGIGVLVPAVFGHGLGHAFSGLDAATIVVYLAISLGVQGMITQSKVLRHHATERSMIY